MHRHILNLLTGLLVAALLLAGLPMAHAQGDPPTRDPDSDPGPLVANLPFSDTFEIAGAWMQSGAWRYDAVTSYDTAGWMVDGSQRNTVSMLEYSALLDLSGVLGAQLFYRQRGTLPASDLVAVDLSLDGGGTWFLVDQQINIATDWEAHTIDLSAYRGQIVRLRFRVNTGPVLATEEPVTWSYHIDNVSIQFVALPDPVPPELNLVAAQALYSGPHTLMGLHLIVGTRPEPVLDLVKRLRDIGLPMGTIKGTSGTEDLLNQVAALSPETIIIYRSLVTPDGLIDCPDTSKPPTVEAHTWMAGIRPEWLRVNADYYEIINECLPPIDWLNEFSIEAMRIASAQGQCLLLFSFASGNPDVAVFDQLRPAIRFAAENPCRPGQHHGIALHAYGIGRTTLVSESGLYLGFRHRLFFSSLLSEYPEVLRLPIYLTEAGPGDGSAPFTCEAIARDVVQYTNQLESDPYILGFHLWTTGGVTGRWLDVTPCLPAIGDALINYYAQR